MKKNKIAFILGICMLFTLCGCNVVQAEAVHDAGRISVVFDNLDQKQVKAYLNDNNNQQIVKAYVKGNDSIYSFILPLQQKARQYYELPCGTYQFITWEDDWAVISDTFTISPQNYNQVIHVKLQKQQKKDTSANKESVIRKFPTIQNIITMIAVMICIGIVISHKIIKKGES